MDVFTPTPRNWKELVSPGDVFSLALEMKTASKSGRLYHLNSKKLERVGKSGGHFYPCARNKDRKEVQWMFLALLPDALEVK